MSSKYDKCERKINVKNLIVKSHIREVFYGRKDNV